ncbi:YbjQ family protein [Shewanella sp. A3A]|nr:YbjQ family protein [Shewanella ferrihydritica]
MKIVTTDTISGYQISATLGVVNGSVVRSKHLGRDIMAGLKTLIGGEIKGYTEMLTEARQIAIERMIAQAEQLDADAVVNVRFTTSAIMDGMSEMLAYGTAVKLTPA